MGHDGRSMSETGHGNEKIVNPVCHRNLDETEEEREDGTKSRYW